MKKITKAIILQRLVDRFKLQEYTKEDFVFLEEVLPVYELRPLLVEHAAGSDMSLVSTAGELILITVPDDERWELLTWSYRHSAGVHTIDTISVVRKKYAVAVYLSMQDIVANDYVLEHLPQPLTLEAGDTIRQTCNSYTSSGQNILDISYIKERVR